MLKISFYNRKQKYTDEFDPFSNGRIRQKIQEAREYAAGHPDVSGWSVSECVGGEWYPYQPFNGSFRYVRS